MHIQNVPRQNVLRQNVPRTKRPKGQTLTVQFFHLLIFPFIYGLSFLLLSLTLLSFSFCTVLSVTAQPILVFFYPFLYCSIPSLLSCPLLCWLVLSRPVLSFISFPVLSWPFPFDSCLSFYSTLCPFCHFLYFPVLSCLRLASFPSSSVSLWVANGSLCSWSRYFSRLKKVSKKMGVILHRFRSRRLILLAVAGRIMSSICKTFTIIICDQSIAPVQQHAHVQLQCSHHKWSTHNSTDVTVNCGSYAVPKCSLHQLRPTGWVQILQTSARFPLIYCRHFKYSY